MKFEDLSPEMQEKARACKTPEDIIALAAAEGYELSEEELDGITGGVCWQINDDLSQSHPGQSFRCPMTL